MKQPLETVDPLHTGEKLATSDEGVFKQFFEMSPDTLIVLNPQKKKFVLANRMACLSSGLTRRQLYAIDPLDLTVEPYREQFYDELQKADATKGHMFELPYKRSDGIVFRIELHVIKINFEGEACYLCSIRDLTKKHKAELALQQQEARWRSVVSHAPGLILTVDRHMNITFMNRDVWFTVEEGIGKNVLEFAGTTYQIELAARIRRVLETGKSDVFESEGGRDYGSKKWYKNMLGPIKNNDEVVGVSLITMDITEEVMERKELQRTKADLLDAQKVARIGSWEYSVEKDAMWFSEALLGIMKVQPPEGKISWLRFMSAVHRQDAARVDRSFQHCLKTGDPFNVEFRALTPDREIVDIHCFATVHFNEEGEAIQITGLAQDITRIKKVERALKLSQDSLQEAQRIAKVGNWEWDRATDNITWSDELYHILGFDPKKTIPDSRMLVSAVHPDDRIEVVQSINECLKSSREYSINHRIIWPNGTIRHVRDIAKPFVDEEGKLSRIIGTLQDVSEQKVAEIELSIANKMLLTQTKRAQRLRSWSIIQGVEEERQRLSRELHDGVGQLLSAVRFNFGLFTQTIAPTPESEHTIKEIKELIDMSINEVVRVSNNLMPAVLRDFGLMPAIKKIVSLFEISSGSAAIHFVHDDFNRRANPEKEVGIFRIAQEAINNAIKYADASEIRVLLEILEDRWISLEVIDDGKGFITTDEENLGNGILNMRERVDLLSGKFNLLSTPGTGTVVSVQIPI